MFRFFLTTKIEDPQNIVISDKEIFLKITKVLRLHDGDTLILFDKIGEEYEVAIKEIKEKKVYCRLISRLNINRELPVEINLFQALLKKDKLELVSQKVTEIGVRNIIPIISENCVVKDLNQNKVKRYEKIIQEATIQSGGKKPPLFKNVLLFEQAIAELNPQHLNILAHEQEKENRLVHVLRNNSHKRIINVFIGPEGGFSPFEIDLARQHSVVLIGLGRKILRAETAAIVACGTIACNF